MQEPPHGSSSTEHLLEPLIPAARSRCRRSAHREKDLEEAVLHVPNRLVNSGVHACHAYSCSRVSLDSEPTCTTDLADEHEHVERAGLGQVHHDGEVHDAQAPAPATSSCGDLVQHQDQYAKAVQHQEDGQRARDEQQQHRSGRRDGRTPRDRASEPARSSRRARATRPTAAGQRLRAVLGSFFPLLSVNNLYEVLSTTPASTCGPRRADPRTHPPRRCRPTSQRTSREG